MNNIFLTFNAPHGMADRLSAQWHRLSLWWQSLPAGVRSPVWLGTLATLVIVGMLLAFHQVVSGAVEQGEMRRKASAMDVEVNWRCGLRASDSCLKQLKAAASNPVLHALNNATGAPTK